jgi:hypothetical protein
MARKAKIDNAIQKRFARPQTQRRQDIKSKRRYFLIVCEGEKTEPNYFEGLKKSLPPHTVELIELDIKGTGLNTLGVVKTTLSEKARIEKQVGRVVDEAWAVFDRDSFPADNFNNAITKGEELGVQCAWSNEAFELWYLLHFQFFQNAMRRDGYQKLLERELKRCTGKDFTYQKKDPAMFALLQQYGDVEKAIERARQLATACEGRTDFADHNPCTTVYKLVEKLLFPETTDS